MTKEYSMQYSTRIIGEWIYGWDRDSGVLTKRRKGSEVSKVVSSVDHAALVDKEIMKDFRS